MKKLNIHYYDKAGSFIGVGVAIGVCIFTLTNEPIWISIGIITGCALGFSRKKC